MNRKKIDDNNPYAKVMLSSISKYLHSECLQSGHFISWIGVIDVYFDQAQPCIEGTEVYIDCIIGTINLYIPKHWNVVNAIDSYIGNVSCNIDHNKLSENVPRLTLTGRNVIGTVRIIYI